MNTVITRQAGRREWISLAVLALPCLLYAMDLTVLNLAVPHLSADLAVLAAIQLRHLRPASDSDGRETHVA